MFDRCDADTVAIIDTALAEARRLDHNWLGTEHVLLAMVQHREHLPDAAAQLLPGDRELRAALDAELGDREPAVDAELLATLGIDLDEVRATVRETFGTDALVRLAQRRVHQPWQPWRRPRRRCTSLLAGAMCVASRLKQAFAQAALDVTRRGRSVIDPAGLLLGILEVEDALANKLLRNVGVAPGDLLDALRKRRS